MALSVALTLGASAGASAQDWLEGHYIGLRAIGSIANMDGVDTRGFAGTTRVGNDSDEVAGIAGVFGYVFKNAPVRMELEVAHRFRFDLDVDDVRPVGDVDYEMNVATTSVLVSAAVEWRNSSEFTPFLGGSVGWARNSTETQRSNLATGVQTDHDNDEDGLAWAALAGVDWDFAENWAAELAYRYIDLGEVDTGRAPSGESITADDYVSHDVLLSVIYRF